MSEVTVGQAMDENPLLTRTQERDRYRAACAEFARYFWNELGWEHFRAELMGNPVSFKNKNASSENAAIIMKALQEIGDRDPDVKAVIMGER